VATYNVDLDVQTRPVVGDSVVGSLRSVETCVDKEPKQRWPVVPDRIPWIHTRPHMAIMPCGPNFALARTVSLEDHCGGWAVASRAGQPS
jgi:hypothetical protein